MKTRMTHAARAELVEAVQSRYSAASGKAKRRILDEFIAASGYHEKSAIRALNSSTASKVRQTRQRTTLRCSRTGQSCWISKSGIQPTRVSAIFLAPRCHRFQSYLAR